MIVLAPRVEVPGDKIKTQKYWFLGVYTPHRPKSFTPHLNTIENMIIAKKKICFWRITSRNTSILRIFFVTVHSPHIGNSYIAFFISLYLFRHYMCMYAAHKFHIYNTDNHLESGRCFLSFHGKLKHHWPMIENENPQRCHHAMATRKLIVRNAANLIAWPPTRCSSMGFWSEKSAPLYNAPAVN